MAHLSHPHAVRIAGVESKQNISRNNRHKCLRCTSRGRENVACSEELSFSALFCLGGGFGWCEMMVDLKTLCNVTKVFWATKPSAGNFQYFKDDWETDCAQCV